MSKAPKLTTVALAVGATTEVELLHALLSASGSKVWITCTPSARLGESIPDEDSEFSMEGTFGHEIYTQRLDSYLRNCLLDESKLQASKYWSQELSESVQRAVDYSITRIEAARRVCPDAMILLEQRLDFSAWVQGGFGRGDLVIITDDYVEVIDLKMGAGVFVDVQSNSQFRLYMLGALHTYGHLYDPKRVIGTVVQPRLNNWASEELEVVDLLIWADEVVVPAAKLAWAGDGPFVPGEHCSSGFCKARFTCAARAQANLAIAQSDFALVVPVLMTDEQISAVLAKGDQAVKWLNDVASYALKEAEKGRKFEGYKLVAGRSNRKYSDPDKVATALLAEGVPEAAIFERSLLTITALEKVLGAKKFTELVGDLIVKPAGKPTLVPVSDKREAINSTASAIADFS